MSQKNSLFREQAIAAASNKLYGNVVVTPKASYLLLFFLILTWLAFLCYCAFSIEWKIYSNYPIEAVSQSGTTLTLQIKKKLSINEIPAEQQVALYQDNRSEKNYIKGQIITYHQTESDGTEFHIQLVEPNTVPVNSMLRIVTAKQTFYTFLTRRDSTSQGQHQ